MNACDFFSRSALDKGENMLSIPKIAKQISLCTAEYRELEELNVD